MNVRALMTDDVHRVSPDLTWLQTLTLMEEKKTNSLYVEDRDGKFLGVVTVKQLLEYVIPDYLENNPDLAQTIPETEFLDLCQKRKSDSILNFIDTDIPQVTPDMTLLELAVDSLGINHYRLVVVDEKGHLIGRITRRIIRDKLIQKLHT